MPNLSPDQATALEALHAYTHGPSRGLALSGPAGTGKSFLIGQFLRETDAPVHLTAATHKAARVVADLSGGEAVTVHSLFGLRPVNDYDSGETYLERRQEPKAESGSLVIVDEASMIARELLRRLAQDAKELDLKLLFVGDPCQLPPVADGSGTPIVFDVIPTLKLTTVHRQAEGNPIIALATAFRQVLDGGAYPVIRPHGEAIRRVDRTGFGGLIRERFTTAEYERDPNYCRLVAWTNARVKQLNAYVRGLLLGPEARRYAYLPGETLVANETITANDKVLLANETTVRVNKADPGPYDPTVGLAGYWLEVTTAEGEDHRLFVPDDLDAARRHLAILRRQAQTLKGLAGEDSDRQARAAWRAYFEAKEAFADLRPPHAVTVHKSQGSTYRHVLVQTEDIGQAVHYPGHLLARLVYVALTRAAETATFYGSLPASLYLPERRAA